MKRGWPIWVMFCALGLAACAGTDDMKNRLPAATALSCLDRQKMEMQACLERFKGTKVETREDTLCVTILCDSLFESNSDRIQATGYTEIESVTEMIKKYPQTSIVVDAHTDCIRTEEENLVLSELQAWTIKKAMVEKGVPASRVKARGWGESKPTASNATEEGRQANRRITIKLMPAQS